MKSHVITILDLPRSVAAAEQCQDSAATFGLMVEQFPAVTPKSDLEVLAGSVGVSLEGFKNNPYSREAPCIACFLSHHRLWRRCLESLEPILILEHDSAQITALPKIGADVWACNLGAPSFGRFHAPPPGFSPLQSKPPPHYLPGAHAYYITPDAARSFLRYAEFQAEPTDVFLNRIRFPFFQEYYPWPFTCRDSFTTIQRPEGCKAKHRPVEIIEP